MAAPKHAKVRRRRLLIAGAATVGAGAAGVGAWQVYKHRPVEPAAVTVTPEADKGFYRTLGRTGLKVSAVGIGTGSIDRPGVIARAVESGMNYLDTSVCYGDSELVLARAFQQHPGLRNKLIVATKWDPGAKTPKHVMLESLDKSLRRLGVDHVDIMQIHWLGGGHMRPDDGFNRLDNPDLYEAMEEAKKSGKVRFFGATSHAGTRSAILQHAIDKDAFDMLLVKMNVLDFEDAHIPELLRKAHEKNIGVVAMKSQPEGGALPPGYEGQKWNVYQANLRWVLSQTVATVVHSDIGTDEDAQDQAIEAARTELTPTDTRLLEGYGRRLSPTYCRGCGDICGAACPDGVAVAPVLQFRMYDRRYGWPDIAKSHYRALREKERWSARCATCERCTDACPYGVDAATRVRDAHQRLEGRGGWKA